MKTLVFCLLFIPSIAVAQKYEFALAAGIDFTNKFDAAYKSKPGYAISIGYYANAGPHFQAALRLDLADVHLVHTVPEANPPGSGNMIMSTHEEHPANPLISVSILTNYYRKNKKGCLFAGVSLGYATASSEKPYSYSNGKGFALGLQAGGALYLSRWIALTAEADLRYYEVLWNNDNIHQPFTLFPVTAGVRIRL